MADRIELSRITIGARLGRCSPLATSAKLDRARSGCARGFTVRAILPNWRRLGRGPHARGRPLGGRSVAAVSAFRFGAPRGEEGDLRGFGSTVRESTAKGQKRGANSHSISIRKQIPPPYTSADIFSASARLCRKIEARITLPDWWLVQGRALHLSPLAAMTQQS